MPIPLHYSQLEFRIRNDDGSETGATWVAASNTNATLNTDTNYRVRFQLLVSGADFTNKTFNLYYKLNSGSYTAIGSGQAVKYSLSSNFANGSDTTRQLTDFTGTYYYLTDNNGMCESSGATLSGAASNYWELEYCIQIDGAYVANNDTISLRVYNGSTALNEYTNTPSITVSEGGAGTDTLTAQAITSGTPTIEKPTIAQKHALTSKTIEAGVPTLEQPTIGQKHVLTSKAITAGIPTIAKPNIGQKHALVSKTISAGTPTVEKPAIGQKHALTSKTITTGIPLVEKPAIGQIHALTSQGILSGVPVIEKPEAGAEAVTVNLTAKDILCEVPVIGKATIGAGAEPEEGHATVYQELFEPRIREEDEELILLAIMELL